MLDNNGRFFSRAFLFAICITLFSCAIQVPPTGGEKDVTPPVIKASIPKNHSVNFNGKTIELFFDEYVALSDVTGQLIVSPLQVNAPEVKAKKRSLIITLNDTLKPNTTYTLNFGNSITDVNEGNALQDFQFVFSTGDVIDSLSISGQSVHAFDLKTDKADKVFLYKDLSDSIPFQKKPDYFSKVDEQGKWRISNVASGTYKLIGINDEDGSFTYTPGELIGFTGKTVAAGSDSVKLRLFKERPQKIFKAIAEGPGRFNIYSGKEIILNSFTWLTDTSDLRIESIQFSPLKDSVTVYYKNVTADSVAFISGKDTFNISLSKIAAGGRKSFQLTATGNTPNLEQPFILKANHPLTYVDSTLITVTSDSIAVPYSLSYTNSERIGLSFNIKWKEKSRYKITLYPGALQDIYQLKNDTLMFDLITKSEKDYGSLVIKFQSEAPVILQLIDEKETVNREVIARPFNSFTGLDPKTYRLKAIIDSNNDRRWTTGNLLEKIQPEQVFYYPDNITVRANWDVEVNWNLNSSNGTTEKK